MESNGKSLKNIILKLFRHTFSNTIQLIGKLNIFPYTWESHVRLTGESLCSERKLFCFFENLEHSSTLQLFFIIFTYFKCQLRSEKWQAHLSSCPPHTVSNYTLVTKGFEKIDKTVKCYFLSFSPTLNAS